MRNAVIYDFETLGQDPAKSPVVSFAFLEFSIPRLSSDVPYSYEDLLSATHFVKFDVMDQLNNYNRKISKDTLKWWTEEVSDRARKQLKPSPDDVSISQLYGIIDERVNLKSIDVVYTRGNTFDPIFLQNIMLQTGNQEPFHWQKIRDTRSMIEGMSFGLNVVNDFMPSEIADKFVKHDPIHDIAADVMRMQCLAQSMK